VFSRAIYRVVRKRNPIIFKAARKLGGIVAMSQALGLSRGAASQWQEIPVDHVAKLEKLTGIPREVLRPDIFRREAA
jgi:DNA-binding transcriptional regulator YdaS (Cro superfamily)